MLPTVDFCGLNPTRLIIGANPFGGYSHQNPERDEEMRSFHTLDNILESWDRAEKAGINTMITNNETPHVLEAVQAYMKSNGNLQWITQANCRIKDNMREAIDEAVEIGCKALYFHGALTDNAYIENAEDRLRGWVEHAKSKGIPVGVAGHSPKAHLWVNSLDIVDFHVVCFFNCGSLHSGEGEKFKLQDVFAATECIRQIQKPCVGYKIMGAGRIDPATAFEYAFENIKDTDVVNVGMHRGDNDDMIEENVRLVRQILE